MKKEEPLVQNGAEPVAGAPVVALPQTDFAVSSLRIKERILELTAKRDTFVDQANQQIIAFNAAIEELKMLIVPGSPDPP
jgi:hypothetical protein